MTVRQPSDRFGAAKLWRTRLVLAACLASSGLALASPGRAQDTVAAVFKAHEIGFFYRSSTTEYACDELRDRVALILVAVGAREDIVVRVTDCNMSLIPSQSHVWERTDPWSRSSPTGRLDTRSNDDMTASVRIRLMLPVEATPKVMEELEKDKSRRELLSRVKGDPTIAFNEPVLFPAQRQQVTLSRRTIRLDPADCELLDALATSVFHKLDVRVVRRSSRCDRGQPSRIPPQITVEALLPVTAAPASQSGTGASTEPEGESSEPEQETPPQ